MVVSRVGCPSAEGEWAGQAVRKAVQAVQSNVAAAVAVSAAAASSSSGS